MTLELKCSYCKQFINSPPAELISPPAVNDSVAVSKYNLCGSCYTTILNWLQGKGLL